MRAQCRAQWEGMYGAFGGQAFPFIFNNCLGTSNFIIFMKPVSVADRVLNATIFPLD